MLRYLENIILLSVVWTFAFFAAAEVYRAAQAGVLWPVVGGFLVLAPFAIAADRWLARRRMARSSLERLP